MATPTFPLRVSASRRFLEGSDARPFFVHADTAWRLLIALDRDEALHYLDDRVARGFNALHIHAINRERTGSRSRAGHEPFFDDDLERPNELYWAHAEDILGEAQSRGFFVLLSAVWFGYGGSGWRRHLDEQNAGIYGKYLGERFARFQNIAWILGGDNDPDASGAHHGGGDKTEATRILSRALRQAAPHQLQTYHAGPESASARWFGEEDWLDINMAYTYEPAQKQVASEWKREPRRPILLGETGYEGESNTGFEWNPALVRRQAWSALLSGACGHAIGNAKVWDFLEGWRERLGNRTTRQMQHLRELMESLEWWKLVPDLEHKLVTRHWASFGGAEDAVAACAHDGSFAIVYVPTRRPLLVDFARLRGVEDSTVRARWFDPTSGAFHHVRGRPLRGEERTHGFLSPELRSRSENERGILGDSEWSDWVLLLESHA